MPTVIIGLLILSLFSLPVLAQDFPKAEVFAGYQFAHLEGGVNASGWNASVTGNVNRWFGIAGDFSGVYKNGSLHTIMLGPVFSARYDKAKPFVHALIGGATGGGFGAFAMAFGGGVDAKLADKIAFRVIQADWLLFRSSGYTSKKNVRISTGIVFSF